MSLYLPEVEKYNGDQERTCQSRSHWCHSSRKMLEVSIFPKQETHRAVPPSKLPNSLAPDPLETETEIKKRSHCPWTWPSMWLLCLSSARAHLFLLEPCLWANPHQLRSSFPLGLRSLSNSSFSSSFQLVEWSALTNTVLKKILLCFRAVYRSVA